MIIVVLLVVVAAGAFFAGMKYQQSRRLTFAGQFGNGLQGNRLGGQNSSRGRFNMGGRQVVGEILSLDDKSLTIKLADGSTKIILLSDTTSIIQATQAAKTDLKAGERVGVFGTQNADGSMTAQNIQLNPMMTRQSTGGPPQQ